jgi:CheY-like chemotaxis protein
MNNINNLPVFIADDDWDERYLVDEIWKDLDLKNPLLFFNNAEELLNHMKLNPDTPPFIIISDVNLPEIDGFELREILLKDESQKYKSIPFIFWSVKASEHQIRKAYDLSAHGFFIKERTIHEIKRTFQLIIEYWLKSKIPE